MPFPAATFDPTKTVVARQSIISLTIAAAATHLLGRFVDFDGSQDLGRLMAPGASAGPAYTARIWEKSRAEKLMFKTTEVKKVVTLLGSLTGLKAGTCTAYLRDPDDAANTAALKSDDFACSIYREGSLALNGDNPTEVTLVIESRKDGAIAWTADVAV
jgi:hypothetical protein